MTEAAVAKYMIQSGAVKTGENPKQRFGDLKPNLALVPASTMIYLALGHEPGAAKYGRFNWRENKVETMTYIAAAMRHLLEWVDGQDKAHDTGQPHLAHALASLSVLVDALETGNAIDNRPIKGKASVMMQMVEMERRRAANLAAKTLADTTAEEMAYIEAGQKASVCPVCENKTRLTACQACNPVVPVRRIVGTDDYSEAEDVFWRNRVRTD